MEVLAANAVLKTRKDRMTFDIRPDEIERCAHRPTYSQMFPLKRRGPEPLYYQLACSLEEAIASGRVGHGTRLPAEKELAHELRLTTGTVRRAWAYLERKGLIIRRQKMGTFIL